MKAILVTDGMPNSCAVCPYRINKEHWRCLLITDLKGHPKYIYWSHEDITRARYSGCPLKPMPDIKTKEAIKLANMINPKATFQEFADGWNACLEELEK